MKIGFIGSGKLGMPCALAINMKGHDVICYDVFEECMQKEVFRHKEMGPNGEPSIEPLLQKSSIKFGSMEDVILKSEIVFVAVQTPHDDKYEGITRLPDERVDFNYGYLLKCVKSISKCIEKINEEKIIVLISTVLPGTIKREIFPIINKKIKFCYNPFFIAMGTTMQDFLNPEFVLFGVRDEIAAKKVEIFYKTIHNKPFYKTSIESAELIKVAYNTFISSKISIVNTLMEICHKIPGANIDEVTDALKMATDRLISTKYLTGGMGDGGGCFLPSSIVLTENGFRPISKIEVGDKVLTSTGILKPVNKVWEREYDGNILFIKTKGTIGEWMTEDHPVIAAKDGRKMYANKKRNTSNSISEKLFEDEEIIACDLSNNYLIPYPKYNGEEICSPEYATEEYIELAGWWLSEGSAELNSRRGRIRFDLHANELEYSKRIEYLLDRCKVKKDNNRGNNATISNKSKENSRAVRFGNMGLTQRLVNDFGSGAGSKFIPNWILFGSEKNIKIILKGILLGDGCCNPEKTRLETISREMADGVFFILNRLGLDPTIHRKPPRGIHKEAWAVSVSSSVKAIELAKMVGFDSDILNNLTRYSKFEVYGYRDNSIYRHVTKIESKEYSGTVYNLWVDDENTFVTSIGSVHNCHPRDNIALSWLSHELDLSYDWFENIMLSREKQTEWFSEIIIEQWRNNPLPIEILGKSFKPETNLIVGSPAILLRNILEEKGLRVNMSDPHVDGDFAGYRLCEKGIYFIGTKHECYSLYEFQKGSVVIDPFRYIKDQPGVKVIRIGE